MAIKVLVVEDNIQLNKSICRILELEGYEPSSFHNLNESLQYIESEKPHIVLLDIMLPDGKGYELIPRINKSDCRVIMLSALNDISSKKLCYEYGADDYITKPFEIEELVYKLTAIKRRILNKRHLYEVGDISFNTDNNEITCNNKSIFVQPSQMKLLKLLYDKHIDDTFLTKKEMADGDISEKDDSNRIQTLVGRLRTNLQEISSNKLEVKTIYGKGYQLVVYE